MKIVDYFESCQLFPLMGIESLDSETAKLLDTMIMLSFGQRTCGSILTSGGKYTDPSQIPIATQTVAAQIVYMQHKETWKTLFDFVEANLKPWIESQTTKTTKYGKVTIDANEGKDTYNQTDKIAGFDSTEFSNDTANEHETQYGKKVTNTNEGEDVETTESRSEQAERLVDYTTKFWIENGLCNRLVTDAVKAITLPLYESEEE